MGRRREDDRPASPPPCAARGESGWTLIEILLVLTIVVLFIGASIGVSSGLIGEMRLRSPAHQLQLYAKTARRLAVSERQPCRLIFEGGGFRIERAAAPPAEENEADTEESASEEQAPQEPEPLPPPFRMAPDVSLSLQRWDDDGWRKPEGGWLFQPSGLCEPLRVRLSSGKGWLVLAFSPLTASAEEEAFEFP